MKWRMIPWIAASGEKLRIKKFSRKANSFLVGFALVLVVAGVRDYYMKTIFVQTRKRPPVFAVGTGKSNILILIFHQLCQDTKEDVGLELWKRLSKSEFKDSLNINPYYLQDTIDYANFTPEKAKELMKYHNADMILYGAHANRECVGGSSDKICYNYFADADKWDLNGIKYHAEYNMVDFSGLQDIWQGNGQQEIDNLIYFVAGISEFQKNNFSSALRKFLMIKDYQENAHILTQISICYAYMNEYKMMKPYVKKLTQLAPGDVSVWTMLGYSHLLWEEHAEALSCFEAIIKIDSNNKVALHALPNLYLNQKIYNKGRYYLEKSIKMYPDSVELWDKICLTYGLLHDYKQAGEWFKKISKRLMNGNNINVLNSVSGTSDEYATVRNLFTRATLVAQLKTIMDTDKSTDLLQDRNEFLEIINAKEKPIPLRMGAEEIELTSIEWK
jgi:tetratricopeptide (TPR) repeat protein